MDNLRQILVIFAHPTSKNSRAQKILLKAVGDLEGVEIRDLYQLYPHFFVDVIAEQDALRRSDLIIFQHPIYWYSCPALLKEWQDAVLEKGFAYGTNGLALRGKDFLQVISSGGADAVYQRQAGNRFLLTELLRPFEATAYLCGLHYHQPFTVQGIGSLSDEQIQQRAQKYRQTLIDYRRQGRSVLTALDTAREGFAHE